MKETEEEILEKIKNSVSKSICGKLFKDCMDDEKAACVDIVAQRYLSERMRSSLPSEQEIENILNDLIEDFNRKWTGHREKEIGIAEYRNKILELLTKGDR
jgi:hypothetical protein